MAGPGSSEEEEAETKSVESAEGPGITDYEKERLQTIRRNRDVLSRLQVKTLATSLEEPVADAPAAQVGKNSRGQIFGGARRRSQRLSSIKGNSSSKVVDWSSGSSEAAAESESDDGSFFAKSPGQKKKKKKISLAELEGLERRKEDVEYQPGGNSDSEESVEDAEELGVDLTRDHSQSRTKSNPAKRPRGRPIKSPGKRTVSINQWPSKLPHSPSQLLPSAADEDEVALQQALALSLGSSLDTTPPKAGEDIKGESSSKTSSKQIGTKSTQKRPNKRSKELYFKQSEIDSFFVSIVGSKEGKLSLRHLENAASDQNFTWTEEELENMIVMFDNDDDGQLNLAEFRSMAERCKLMDAF